MKTKTDNGSTKAYELAIDSCMRTIAEIESQLTEMPAAGSDVNWSYVGTAAEINSRLRAALEIINNVTK